MKGYRTILIGALMVILPPLLSYLAGIHWADYVSPDVAAMISGIIVIALRVVTTTPVGKALIAFLIMGVALMAGQSAFAGDIASPALPFAGNTKANNAMAAPTKCDVTGCTGPWVGAEFSASGTGVNLLNLGSVSANGNYMGAAGGYQFYNGTYWLGVRVDATYDLAPPSALVSPGFSNKFFAFEGVEIGGNLAAMFGIPPIVLPGPLAGAVPTILLGGCQNGAHLQGYCAGAGAHFFIPNSMWTVDALYLNAQYGTTTIATGQTANVENRGTLGFSRHF